MVSTECSQDQSLMRAGILRREAVLTSWIDPVRSRILESVRDELCRRRIRKGRGRYRVEGSVLQGEVRVMLMEGRLSLQRIHRVVDLHVHLSHFSLVTVHLLLLMELVGKDAVERRRSREL